MKKVLIILTCMSIILIGCTDSNTVKETGKNAVTKYQNADKTETIQEHRTDGKKTKTAPNSETKRMVMLDDKLYVDTGEKGVISCGVMDFSFNKTTNKVPTKNGQTNFGKGYQGQYYLRDNCIIIMIDEKPCVFAYNENDIEGVTMYVKRFSKKKAEICIKNLSELEWECDRKFELERFDLESGAWKPVNQVQKNVAFKDVAYMIEPGKSSNITVEWEWLYGILEKGNYRIVKKVNPAPYLSVGRDHTYTAEFEILK